jgi:hypothetical protein
VPILPVKLVGGLPRAPLAARTEFPVHMGQQDIIFGAPLAPEALAALPYGERKKAVLAAINALGPAAADEDALPGDPEFAARVARWVERTGCSEEHAVLWSCLQDLPEVSPPIARLLEGGERGALRVGDGPEEDWLAELAAWVYGPTGPKIFRG